MKPIRTLYNAPLTALETRLAPWLLPSLARFAFAAVLLAYFWASARLKLGDGLFELSFGAYGQILPRAFEAAGYDPAMLSPLHHAVAFGGTYAEFLLPGLIIAGLFTRLAAAGMIGFVAVQSYVDIYGHMADDTAIGGWFDRVADSQIMDQRLLWVTLLTLLALKGAGPLSMDRLLGLK